MVASGLRLSARGVKPRISENRMTTSAFHSQAAGRLGPAQQLPGDLFIHIAPEGVADKIPFLQPRTMSLKLSVS